jgi:hypothetical protein
MSFGLPGGATQNVKPWKGSPGGPPLPYAAKPAGFRHGAVAGMNPYDLGPNLTARKAKQVRSARQPGTGVGQVRPRGWWPFLNLLGPNGLRKWVQGHFINRRLGGQGAQNNLAPFTYSMNSVHYQSVERFILWSVGGGVAPGTPVGAGGVSYTVKAIPNPGGTQNENFAVAWHQGFLAGNLNAALLAMVGAGTLNALDIPLIQAAPLNPLTATPNTPAGTWGAVQANTVALIRQYVRDTFPAGIVCRARYYGPTKQVGQVLIDNTA